MTSLRLSKQLERWIVRAAKLAGVTKSVFIRQCLEDRRQAEQSRPDPYELGKDLFGGDPSDRSDLTENSRQIVRDKFHAKSRRP